jgi:hypothetical protein
MLEHCVGFGNFVRSGILISEPTRRFLRPWLLWISGKFWASVLVRVRVESLGPCPWAAYGTSVLGEAAEMCEVNLQSSQALPISVEARDLVQFIAVRGKFGRWYAR